MSKKNKETKDKEREELKNAGKASAQVEEKTEAAKPEENKNVPEEDVEAKKIEEKLTALLKENEEM